MGTGASNSSQVDVVSREVATVINNSMMRVGASVDLLSDLTVDCRQFAEDQARNIVDCRRILLEQGRTPEYVRETCDLGMSAGIRCAADRITLIQSVNLSVSQAQLEEVKTNVRQSLEAQLQSRLLASSGGLLEFGNETKESIASLAQLTANIVGQNIQNFYTNVRGEQRIFIRGADVSFVTLEMNLSHIESVLSQNRAYVDAVQNVALHISQELGNQSQLVAILVYVAVAVLGVVIIVIVILVAVGVLGRAAANRNVNQLRTVVA